MVSHKRKHRETVGTDSDALRPGVGVTILTGFLGAGKTTLMNSLLKHKGDLKIAVFVNELGAVDVDGEIMMRQRVDDTDIVVLDDGCVCCTINRDLAVNVQRVVERGGIDHIFVETTGVADPEPVSDTLTSTDLAFSTHIHAVVLVADALNFCNSLAAFPEVVCAQLRGCDMILLSKVDLASEDQINTTEKLLADLTASNPCTIHRMSHGEVPIALVVGGRPRSTHTQQADHPSKQLGRAHHSFEAMVFEAERPFCPIAFEEFVAERLPLGVVRAKGTLWLQGVPPLVIFHLVGRRTNPFETVAGSQASSTRLVLIGTGLDRAGLEADLRKLLVT